MRHRKTPASATGGGRRHRLPRMLLPPLAAAITLMRSSSSYSYTSTLLPCAVEAFSTTALLPRRGTAEMTGAGASAPSRGRIVAAAGSARLGRRQSRRRRVSSASSLVGATKMAKEKTTATALLLSNADDDDAEGEAVADSGEEEADSAASSSSPSRWSVPAVLLSAFLNLLGFTMAGPITPALGRHFGLDVGASFGSLTSAYPLGMLLGLFLWPALSDRVGRKPVMALSLLGSGVGLGAQAHAVRAGWDLRSFLLARVMTGSFAGSSPVSKAYLADLGMAAGELPRYLAWRDAASTLSFIAGPALGGLFFEARRRAVSAGGAEAAGSLAFVIGVTSAASLAAAALIALFVREIPKASNVGKNKAKNDPSASDAASSVAEGHVSCPLGTRLWTGVATVCVVSFLFNVGDSTFHAFFPALMRDGMGLDTGAIGVAFTCFACLSFLVSAGVTGLSVKRLGPVPTCAAGLGCVGAGLLGMSLGSSACSSAAGAAVTAAKAAAATVATAATPLAASSFFLFGAAALYYCGVPLYGPTVPTMLLRCVRPDMRGAVMGLDGAINTIARVISPLLVGELYRRRGPGAAFGAAAGAVLGAAVLAVGRRLTVMKERTTSSGGALYVEAKGGK